MVGLLMVGCTKDLQTPDMDQDAQPLALKKEGAPKFTEKTSALLADGYQDMMWELDPQTKFRICQMRIYLLD